MKRRSSTDGKKICPTAEKREGRRTPKHAISKQTNEAGERGMGGFPSHRSMYDASISETPRYGELSNYLALNIDVLSVDHVLL